ncbi:hypothetical protein [Niveibacterium sp. SC-1]|uniref:DUF4129 domain-containing protein n=1 Tax=Niveibacterium sp. SC-1 TaxID=3135646 RepID=UPI00311E40A6
MDAERLSVALRPRTAFEAMDLGVRLAQRAARPLFLGCLILALAATAFSQLLLNYFYGSPMLALLAVWWLKPLFDRTCLHVLAHAVFDATPSLAASLRALPGLLRQRGLIAALTWRRFDPLRSLRLPVEQLEGLRGRPARARRKLLAGRVGGAGIASLSCFAFFELVLWVGLIGFVALVVPSGDEILPSPIQTLMLGDLDDHPYAGAIWGVVYAFIVGMLEPFFVACGFGLYLKRRTDLEAWDVELQLRRVAARLASPLVAVVFAIAVGSAVLAPAPTQAQATPADASPPASAARSDSAEPASSPAAAHRPGSSARREAAVAAAPKAIREVLAQPEFGTEKTTHSLRWKRDEERKARPGNTPRWLRNLVELIAGFGKLFAEISRVVIYGVLAVVGLVLVWLLLRQARLWRLRRLPPPPPAEVAGLDIRPESLPDDIVKAVRGLLDQGHQREALALLYRAALSRLAHRERIAFERGDTEGDCLMRVTRARAAAQAYFAQLTLAWQRVAYARQSLAGEQLDGLCTGWARAFGAAA